MTKFHLRGTGLEDHSLLNEDQVAVKKNSSKHIMGGSARSHRRMMRVTSCRCWTLVALLAALWLVFFGLWVYCNYLADDFSGSVGHPVGRNVEARLVILPQELADKTGAYCLDGSPPSYYFRNASSEERRDSWIIHLSGSSWCYNTSDCAHRGSTLLGSSHAHQQEKKFFGLLSADYTVNPDFYDWNVAIINYCDGASYSGNRDQPVLYNTTKIYYRGFRVLDAVIHYLLHSAGLKGADGVLLSGESAGALAVFLHADHIHDMLPEGTSFKAVADGGFFLDENSSSGEPWRTTMKTVYNMQQVEETLDEDCILAKGTSKKWECFFPEYAYPYVTTPIFIINSVYDSWVQRNILGLDCKPSSCGDDTAGLLKEHKETFLQRTDQVRRYDKDGMFISSCYTLTQANSDTSWTAYKVAGKATREAFGDWYFGRTTSAESRYIDCFSDYKCNPSCSDT